MSRGGDGREALLARLEELRVALMDAAREVNLEYILDDGVLWRRDRDAGMDFGVYAISVGARPIIVRLIDEDGTTPLFRDIPEE